LSSFPLSFGALAGDLPEDFVVYPLVFHKKIRKEKIREINKT
jgi:hypothetical protein